MHPAETRQPAEPAGLRFTGVTLGLLLLLVTAVYAGAWRTRYGFSDDYGLLTGAMGVEDSVTAHVIAGGRPLLAPVYAVAFGAVDDIAGLGTLRLLGAVGVALAGWVVAVALRRSGFPAALAAGTGAAVCLLPTFQGMVGFTTSFPLGFACAVAGAGGLVLTGPLGATVGGKLAAGAAFAIAFLLYQPAAMFVWLPLVVDLVRPGTDWNAARRVAVRHVGVVAAALAGALVVALGVTVLTDTDVLDRAAVLGPTDVPGKVVWFLGRPLAISARPYLVDDPSAVDLALTSLPVLALVGAGLVLLARGSMRERLLVAGATATSLPLAVLPNLVTSENQFEFRTLAGIAPIVLVLAVVSARAVAQRLVPRVADAVTTGGLIVLVAVAGVGAVRLVDDLFVDPSTKTLAFVAEALRGVDPQRHERIEVVLPPWPERPRLGIYSTLSDLADGWVASPMTALLLRERGIEWDPDDVVEVGAPRDTDDEVFVLDATPLRDQLAAER